MREKKYLTTITLVILISIAGLYLTSSHSYLLFGSFTGVISVIIAFSIFLITWIGKRHSANSFWVVLGIAYLFIGMLYLLYTLSYDGMQIFKDHNYGNQALIAVKYLESISLFTVLFFFNKKIKYQSTFLYYAFISIATVLSIFIFKIFPSCFVEGYGPTLFYTVSQYTVVFTLLSSVILLVKRAHEFGQNIYKLVLWSYILNTLYQLTSFSYISGFYIVFFLGTCLRIVSLYLMFKAAFEACIIKPHNALLEELRIKQAKLEEISLVDDLNGVLNRRAAFNTLEKMIKLLRRNKQNLSVCYIGLDNFNEVINCYGDEEGKIMVSSLISSLKESIRQSDYICRLDDDEFLLILPECGSEKVYIIIERVKESLHSLNTSIDKPYIIDFSYGLASYNYNNTFDIDSLLRIADFNMYQNKTMKMAVNDEAYDIRNIVITDRE